MENEKNCYFLAFIACTLYIPYLLSDIFRRFALIKPLLEIEMEEAWLYLHTYSVTMKAGTDDGSMICNPCFQTCTIETEVEAEQQHKFGLVRVEWSSSWVSVREGGKSSEGVIIY